MSKEIIVAFLTGILGPVVLVLLKTYLDKRKTTPDMVKETLRVSELITHSIDEIREEFKADRVWITQFHNGGNFYPTGKSIAKFSFMYETVSTSVNSIQLSFQNIPVYLFSKSINQLLENNFISIGDYTDVTTPTYGLKYAAEEYGCKSGYLFAIKTIDNKFIGVMGIDYTKRKKQLSSQDINDLEVHSSSLGGVLINEK